MAPRVLSKTKRNRVWRINVHGPGDGIKPTGARTIAIGRDLAEPVQWAHAEGGVAGLATVSCVLPADSQSVLLDILSSLRSPAKKETA
jgi:hypothetical protein